MELRSLNQRLSRIQTQWSMIFQAHRGDAAAVSEAQRVLLQRYAGAVYRYLLGIHRDPDVADDLAQEFAMRFLRGDFRKATPERGRFRDFVKTSLRHLVIDHHRRAQARPRVVPVEELSPADLATEPANSDADFLASWREELLDRTWEALDRHEKQSGQPYYTVLRFRALNPEVRSNAMAEQLASRLGRDVTAAWVRQTLHRARERFGELLCEEVLHSLERPTRAELEQELIDLGLLEYCRAALARYGEET